MFKYNRDFSYPIEISKCRHKLITKELEQYGQISTYSYNLILKQINADIYDNIAKIKEWNSFSIKRVLYPNYAIGTFIPKKREMKDMISLGLNNNKIALDNYKQVLEGVDISDDSRNKYDIRVLVEQICNADIYTDNYDAYMSNLIARLATNYNTGDYYYNYIEEMEEKRKNVLTLKNMYGKKNNLK